MAYSAAQGNGVASLQKSMLSCRHMGMLSVIQASLRSSDSRHWSCATSQVKASQVWAKSIESANLNNIEQYNSKPVALPHDLQSASTTADGFQRQLSGSNDFLVLHANVPSAAER